MSEWGVIGVIITVIGLIITVCTPIIKLNTSITKLTSTIDALVKRVAKMEDNSHESHQRLWAHNEEQDKIIGDHEKRISIIEEVRRHP